MKKFTQSALLCLAFSLLIHPATIACTNVTIKAKDNSIIVGRTLEFGADLKTDIITSPKGRSFTTKTPDGKIGLAWKSRFAYLFMDFFKTGRPVDGLNQKGLSFGYLYLPNYTKYPELTSDKSSKSLPYYYLGDWILGNFSTTKEVKQALNDVVIYNKPMNIGGHNNVSFPLHAIVTDANNDSIVIEFINGKTVVYDNPLGVLTNSPGFPWQLSNLKNYANLSPYSPLPVRIDGYTYSGTGQGSGMVGLPGDTTPPSRFVKITLLSQTAMPVDNAARALNLAQHILNTVDIPDGFVRSRQDSEATETTQWTVYKDLTHQVLYFKSYDNSSIQKIDMHQLNLQPGDKIMKTPIMTRQTIVNATNKLKG